MKYIRYITILVWKILAKAIGLVWYYVAVLFRGYSRNVVYNYVLQNNIHLPRLFERKPSGVVNDKYLLTNIRDTEEQGYIKYRKINAIEYYLVLFLLWGWVDDDSNYDTHDGTKAENPELWGNAFDLGDARADKPIFDWKRSSLWNIRNTAYNFNYMFEEIAEDSPYNFYIRYKNWHFGYIPYTNSVRKGRMVWFSEDIDKVRTT